MYFFEDHFNNQEHKENFEFYEPKTVHESSLSPCIHSILATRLGKVDKAYEFYLMTSRLDLDDYNKEVNEGLHITSMAGTWLSVIEGFAGVKIKKQKLYIDPKIPKNWKNLSFNILVNNNTLGISIDKRSFTIVNKGPRTIKFSFKSKDYQLNGNEKSLLSI